MKKLYILAAVALIFAACEKNEDNPELSPIAADISATIGDNDPTRASNNSWTATDSIGITIETGGIRPHVNMKYTTIDGSENFTGNPIYFYKPMIATAYYPFSGEEGSDAGVIDARTDILNQSTANQSKIDFLWSQLTAFDVVDNKPHLNFRFDHKMSKLSLIFEDGNNKTDEEDGPNRNSLLDKIVRYDIEGLVLNGSFDTATGVCSVNPDSSAETLSVDINGRSVISSESLDSFIIFPQNPGNDNIKLHIYTNETDDPQDLQHYSCSLKFDEGEIISGKNYIYTIKVSKAEFKVENSNITNWTDTDKTENAGSSDDE